MKGLGTNTFCKGIEEGPARGGSWVFTQEPVSLLLRKDSFVGGNLVWSTRTTALKNLLKGQGDGRVDRIAAVSV